MEVTNETLQKVLQMAALALQPEEQTQIYNDFRRTLNWVEKLQEVDTEDIAPLTTMSPEVTQLAKDEPKEPLTSKMALRNGPQHDGVYFVVPQKNIQINKSLS